MHHYGDFLKVVWTSYRMMFCNKREWSCPPKSPLQAFYGLCRWEPLEPALSKCYSQAWETKPYLLLSLSEVIEQCQNFSKIECAVQNWQNCGMWELQLLSVKTDKLRNTTPQWERNWALALSISLSFFVSIFQPQIGSAGSQNGGSWVYFLW